MTKILSTQLIAKKNSIGKVDRGGANDLMFDVKDTT